MQYDDYVRALNKNQLEAVSCEDQYLRIVAGAGSGKTRVLTYRISFLMSEMKVFPWKILAITFTNKVANEMKERIAKLVPEAGKSLTIKTFHSFCAMFLRQEISVINYPLNFTILDEEDQTKLVKDIARSKGYKKNDPIIKKAINYIGSCKLREQYPEDVTIAHERFEDEKVCLEIYTEYEELKAMQLALDFDDLLLKTNYILSNYPMIAEKWKYKYSHILVDEFQDTNNSEYKLLKNLMNELTSLFVVGDPDQNIYTWRGAQQDIIMNLEREFPTLKTIILNENYRSTESILDSANKLISNNKLRVPKDLFTNNGVGESITTRNFDSGAAEAFYVSREINTLVKSGKYKYSDITLLYRSNYLTLEFEKSFMAHNIPYIIYGGTKFYQRMEVKDVIAFFRIINNVKDDISFERIINIPKRGIGEKSIDIIKSSARLNKQSIFEFIQSEEILNTISKKIADSLRSLVTQMILVREKIDENDEMFSKILEDFITDIGYYNYLKDMDDGEDRCENVKSLFEDIRHFLKSNPDSTFEEYLQNVALVSAQDDITDGDNVKLMTVHTAKGLEFPVVFIVRLNQGVFPNNRALAEDGYKALEEERRLAYVAFTRAKERLYLTYYEGFSYINSSVLSESQFISESGNKPQYKATSVFYINQSNDSSSNKRPYSYPQSFVSKEEPKSVKQDFNQNTNDITSWAVGDVVIHKKLGRGVVVAVEDDSIIKVNFDEHGMKTILGNHPAVSKGSK